MSAINKIIKGTLKSHIINTIRLKGPMRVSDYMRTVLTNPDSGFYMNKDVFGVKGHFTTSPEISQMFGECLGAWIINEWRRFDPHSKLNLNLIEFGPGRGTLMSDLLRTIGKLRKTIDNVNISFIEISPTLRESQKLSLAPRSNLLDRTRWYNQIEEMEGVQDSFEVYIAHEYLDALPIFKFTYDNKSNRWREILIDYDKDENLVFQISMNPSLAGRLLIPEKFVSPHFEVCPDAALTVEKVAKRLNKSKSGCMIICDYGFEEDIDSVCESPTPNQPLGARPNRDTFRAFKNHQSWPPLSDPGLADLTADVDFGYIKRHLKPSGSLMFGSVTQKQFLTNCGIYSRLEALLSRSNDQSDKDLLISETDMMVRDMGERYRFLSLFPKGTEDLFKGDPPAGFN